MLIYVFLIFIFTEAHLVDLRVTSGKHEDEEVELENGDDHTAVSKRQTSSTETVKSASQSVKPTSEMSKLSSASTKPTTNTAKGSTYSFKSTVLSTKSAVKAQASKVTTLSLQTQVSNITQMFKDSSNQTELVTVSSDHTDFISKPSTQKVTLSSDHTESIREPSIQKEPVKEPSDHTDQSKENSHHTETVKGLSDHTQIPTELPNQTESVEEPSDYTIIITKPADDSITQQPDKPSVSQPEYPFVVPFIYQRKYPPAPVCSGSILTERYILSAAYPIAVMPRTYFCALPGFPNLLEVTAEDVEQKCIGISDVLLSDDWKPPPDPSPDIAPLNLAVVKLNRTIEFTWFISTGRIPYPDNVDTFQYGQSCALAAWKYRSAITGPGFPLKQIATELKSEEVTLEVTGRAVCYIWPKTKSSSFEICAAHIGMPVLCDCSIIGVIALEFRQGYTDCKTVQSMSYTPIINKDVQRFLNATIPTGFGDADDYDEDVG